MNLRFDDKVVIITGASTGLGAAMARAFGAGGATVGVHYHNSAARAEDVVRDIERVGGRGTALQADLSSPAGQQRLVDEVADRFPDVDVLINNAGGLVDRRPTGEVTRELYDAVMELNFGSVVALCNGIAPTMRSREGAIINVTSVAAVTGGGAGASVYAASKGAVTAYTRALAKELASQGVRVNAISPGVIETPFHDRYTSPELFSAMVSGIPMGRAGTAEECVGAALFLASRELSGYVTGQVLAVNGGQHFLG